MCQRHFAALAGRDQVVEIHNRESFRVGVVRAPAAYALAMQEFRRLVEDMQIVDIALCFPTRV